MAVTRLAVLLLIVPACATTPRGDEARTVLARADQVIRTLGEEAGQAEWARWTNTTPATEAAAAAALSRHALAIGELVRAAHAVDQSATDADTRRQLGLLSRQVALPAPVDPRAAEQLASVREALLSAYGANACVDGACKDAQQVGTTLRESRDPVELRRWWTAWHDAADGLRDPYARLVELGNQGARDLGHPDLGALWRSWYDLPPNELAAEVQRLWGDVEPLYRKLHCHVRARLAEAYPGEVRLDRPIPAHLLGNPWGQDWRALGPQLGLAPHAEQPLTMDAQQMVREAESFYVSLGFPPLPETFWQRSMFTRPEGREAICQPGVHDLGLGHDPRLSMCLRPIEKDLIDLHHELGHAYYNILTRDLPPLYRDSPHDGFHEAIGDALTLSLPRAGDGRLERLMWLALDKLPYLAFAVVVDQWRWQVFAGEIPRAGWNRAWWELRERYQGIAPPTPRGPEHFDAGAKFHVASGHPYLRYFLSLILQFQIHAALCPGGPLDQCSIRGNAVAGARLRAFLALGASRPWPDALETLTGSRRMEAGPLLAYFAPLSRWLDEQGACR